jgi:hypothetical protein
MKQNEVHINEMNLRFAGMNMEEARQTAQDVAHAVSTGLPAGVANKSLDTLDLKVRVPYGSSRAEMSILIAEAVLKGLI